MKESLENKNIIRNKNIKKTMISSSILLLIAMILSRFLGFGREMVIAYIYGVSLKADAFYLAFTFPELINKLLVSGAIGAMLIPAFSKYMSRNKKLEAGNLYIAFRNILFIGTLILSICIFFFSLDIIEFLSPALNGESKELTANLLRIMIFSIIILALSGITRSYLNAQKLFGPSAFAPVIQNTIFIVFILLLNPIYGVYSLAIAYLISVFVQYIFQQYFLKGTIEYASNFVLKHRDVKRILISSIPALFTLALIDLNVIIDRLMAANLDDGSVAAINYANKLIQLPVGILGGSVVAMLYPYLADFANNRQFEKLFNHFKGGTKIIAFITIPASILFIVMGDSIIDLVFGYGAFRNEAISMTFAVLQLYSLALFFNLEILLLIKIFHSIGKVRTPMIIGLSVFILKIILSFILMEFFGYKGLVLSSSISIILGAILLLIALRVEKVFKTKRIGVVFISKLAVLNIICFIMLEILLNYVFTDMNFIAFSITVLLFGITYLFVSYLLKMKEVTSLAKLVKRKK